MATPAAAGGEPAAGAAAAAAAPSFREVYRDSSVGKALIEALDEMVTSGALPPNLAMRTLDQFDRSICEALATRTSDKLAFKGKLANYRFFENVWTFHLEAVKIDVGASYGGGAGGARGPPRPAESVSVDRLKIIACDSKQAAAAPAPTPPRA